MTEERIELKTLIEEIRLLRQDFTNLKQDLHTLEENVCAKISENCKDLENRQNIYEARLEKFERDIRRNNIVIFGLETNNFQLGILIELVIDFFKSNLNIEVDKRDINTVYPIGKSHNKPIKVEFISFWKKIEVLQSANKLKGKHIYLNNDLTLSQQKEGRILRQQLKLAKAEDPRAYIRKNKLYACGQEY